MVGGIGERKCYHHSYYCNSWFIFYGLNLPEACNYRTFIFARGKSFSLWGKKMKKGKFLPTPDVFTYFKIPSIFWNLNTPQTLRTLTVDDYRGLTEVQYYPNYIRSCEARFLNPGHSTAARITYIGPVAGWAGLMALNKLAVFDFSEIENMTFFFWNKSFFFTRYKETQKKKKTSLYFLSSQFTILKMYKVNNKYFMFFFFLTGVIIILKKKLQKKKWDNCCKFKLY